MLLEGKNAVIYGGGGSIGNVATFAASDQASIITGTAINITGGTVVD